MRIEERKITLTEEQLNFMREELINFIDSSLIPISTLITEKIFKNLQTEIEYGDGAEYVNEECLKNIDFKYSLFDSYECGEIIVVLQIIISVCGKYMYFNGDETGNLIFTQF